MTDAYYAETIGMLFIVMSTLFFLGAGGTIFYRAVTGGKPKGETAHNDVWIKFFLWWNIINVVVFTLYGLVLITTADPSLLPNGLFSKYLMLIK